MVTIGGMIRKHFNSQPHKEADYQIIILLLINMYFNSQPHKEADEHCYMFSFSFCSFQLTASQGG